MARSSSPPRFLTISASGETVQEAEEKALRYVAGMPGSVAVVVAHRRRRIRLGILGYRVWDFRIRIDGPRPRVERL